MKTSLLKYCRNQDEKEELKSLYSVSGRVRRTVCSIIDEKLTKSEEDSHSIKRYFMPRWSEYQSDQVGYRRALKEIRSLLDD